MVDYRCKMQMCIVSNTHAVILIWQRADNSSGQIIAEGRYLADNKLCGLYMPLYSSVTAALQELQNEAPNPLNFLPVMEMPLFIISHS